MSTKKGNIVSHLTLSDRMRIETGLVQGETFKSIAKAIEKDPSTISKEVRRFLEWHDGITAADPGNNCRHYSTCTFDMMCFEDCSGYCKDCYRHICNKICDRFEPVECPHIKCAPYVCNGCSLQEKCNLTKYFYDAEEAHERYRKLLVDSRSGINMQPDEFQKLNDLISPLIRNGQPLSHIFSIHSDEIPCSRNTVYNYLDQGLFDVRNIDLPRRVRYKVRKKRRGINPVQYEYRKRRSYKDFLKYTQAFPEYEVVEMDTVKGSREAGKCLLTLLFRNSNFMLVFLLPDCTQSAVKHVFDYLYEGLGPRIFRKTFRVILTDNGPEFKDPWSIERDAHGQLRTKVFFCDPYSSNQKGKIEKNHEFIRYIIPKGRSMHFMTDEHARLLMCHINSVARDTLNGQTPFDLAELLINKKVLHLLGLRKVSPDDIILKPTLLRK